MLKSLCDRERRRSQRMKSPSSILSARIQVCTNTWLNRSRMKKLVNKRRKIKFKGKTQLMKTLLQRAAMRINRQMTTKRTKIKIQMMKPNKRFKDLKTKLPRIARRSETRSSLMKLTRLSSKLSKAMSLGQYLMLKAERMDQSSWSDISTTP